MKRENFQCDALCDPHMKLYSGTKWELHKTGEYIMYVNKFYDTEVNIYVTLNKYSFRLNYHLLMLMLIS